MIEARVEHAETGVKVVGEFVDLISATGAKFLELEICTYKVSVDNPATDEYVTAYAKGQGPAIAAEYAAVLPVRGGWDIEAFGYRVQVRFRSVYTSVVVINAATGAVIARLWGYHKEG